MPAWFFSLSLTSPRYTLRSTGLWDVDMDHGPVCRTWVLLIFGEATLFTVQENYKATILIPLRHKFITNEIGIFSKATYRNRGPFLQRRTHCWSQNRDCHLLRFQRDAPTRSAHSSAALLQPRF